MRSPLWLFRVCQLLLVVTLLVTLTPAGSYAQGPVGPTAEPEAPAEPEADPALPDGYAPPADLSGLSSADLAALGFPDQLQGVVQLTVLVSPARFRAPLDLTYTYVYTNTGGSPATGVSIRATWSKYVKVNPGTVDPARTWQYCADNSCQPESVQGPAVARTGDITSGGAYSVGDLAPGQSGRFQIRLRVPNNIYPIAGQEPRRPAGSAQIFLNNNLSTPISEESAAALVEGPVFVITKTRTATSTRILPLDVGEFRIKLENQQREDSIAATGISFIDVLPRGSEFVSTDSAIQPIQETVNSQARLRWEFPGPLNPGSSIEFLVRFRKLDVTPCDRLENLGSGQTITSAEMPLKPGSSTERYTVAGKTIAYTVQAPVDVTSVVIDPTKPVFGTEATITLKVRNYWPQAFSGGQLTLNVPAHSFYRPGSAIGGTVIQAPDGLAPGGAVIWQLDMAAGSIAQPTEKTFAIGIRGGFPVRADISKTATASVTVPANLPGNCVAGEARSLTLDPRLQVRKYTEVERINGRLLARQGEQFPYVISLTNIGIDPITDAVVVDTLPDENGANFTFTQSGDNARLDDVPFPPESVGNFPGGAIIWRGISVPPGETRYLRYSLAVDGLEFRDYCNTVSRVDMETEFGEAINVTADRVCVRINPDIDLTKTLVNSFPNNTLQGPVSNFEVKFQLTITNNEAQSYDVALYDLLPAEFTFLRVESGNAGSPTVNDFGHLEWPVQALAPGSSRSAVIVTAFNPPCARKTYTNELQYLFRNNTGGIDRVFTIPRTVSSFIYQCGSNVLEYGSAIDRTTASLSDRVIYTINVTNKNTTDPISNVRPEIILPAGFRFEAMQSSQGNPTTETLSDGRQRLRWNIPSLNVSARASVIFAARTSNVIGSGEALVIASADNLLEARCTSRCKTFDINGQTASYSTTLVEVRPLHTVTPKILSNEQCAAPGDIRTYSLTLINTNTRAYNSTAVSVTLPLGLHFLRTLGNTPLPELLPQTDGTTIVRWKDLTVAQKPANAVAFELELQIELEVGQVWSDQETKVEADSPDGLIPRTDGEIDPAVKICIDGPGIAKDSSLRLVRELNVAPNQEFIYQIELVNPGENTITATIEDQLPSNVQYVARVIGPNPQITGSTLRWSNLSVPPASSQGVPGVARIQFRVRFTGGAPGSVFTNTVTVIESSEPLDQRFTSIGVEVDQRRRVYLPLIAR